MARRRVQNRNNTNKKPRRLRRSATRRRIPVRNNRSSNSQSLGPLVAKGVRTLLGALPGSSITTQVADFIFSAIGWSNEDPRATTGVAVTLDAVQVSGLCAAFDVDFAMFAASIPSIGTITPKMSGNPELADIQTQWRACRITSLKIVARPSGPIGTVSGTWAIGYTPYSNADSQLNLKAAVQHGVTFEMVRQMSCSAMGDANKPLSIRYYHTVRDGDAYQPKTVEQDLGLLVIAYSDLMRSAYSEFTQSDFQTAIDCSATLVFSCRDPYRVITFNNTSDSVITTPMCVSTKTQRLTFSPTNFKCENNRKGSCKVSGVVDRVNPDSLASMALD